MMRNSNNSGDTHKGASTIPRAPLIRDSFGEAMRVFLEAEGTPANKRLRISSLSRGRPLMVATLPECVHGMRPPISILKDVPQLPANIDGNGKNRALANAPWRIRDSSDLAESEGAEASTNAVYSTRQKNFVSRPNNVDASCFFLLVENKEFTEVLPISKWLTFSRVPPGSENLTTFEDVESKLRAQAYREAALTARVELLRRTGDSDDEKGTAASSARHAVDFFADELGLQRQKKKRLKHLLKERTKSAPKRNEYINSALSLAELRKEEVTWDFEEGERSDDEEETPEEQNKQQRLAGLESGIEEALETDDDEETGDALNLTSYGQKMKNLLDKAKEDEADDELHQYESGDEDEDGNEDGEEASAASTNCQSASDSIARTTKVLLRSCNKVGNKNVLCAAGVKESLESRVIRIMQQHMGRMTVKDFMSAFKVKQKNEEFRKIQVVVHKICKMETNEAKQKFIVLRPEYRM